MCLRFGVVGLEPTTPTSIAVVPCALAVVPGALAVVPCAFAAGAIRKVKK